MALSVLIMTSRLASYNKAKNLYFVSQTNILRKQANEYEYGLSFGCQLLKQ